MAATNYPIKKQLAEHFMCDLTDTENDYMTVPSLLRRIADFMDQKVIRDAEFNGLIFGTMFPGNGGDPDDSYEHATLFYHAEGK